MSKNPYPTQQGTSPSAPYGEGYPQQQQPPQQPGLYPSVNQGFPSAPPSYDQSQQQAASGWQAPQQQTSSYPTAGPPYSGGAGATSPYPQSQEKPQQQPGYAPMNYGGPADQPSQKGQTPYPTQGGGVTYVQVPMPAATFDAGARFGGSNAPMSIPPPPPGVAPNAAQAAQMAGAKVDPSQIQQKKGGFFKGSGSGGYTFW